MNPGSLLVDSPSWVIVHRASGKGRFETFERKTAEAYLNNATYKPVPIMEYLTKINADIKAGGPGRYNRRNV